MNITIQPILEAIRTTEKKYHRPPNSVSLLAVSKKQSADKIRQVYHAGQKSFGENYCQEALEKQRNLSDCAIEWHFIGSIQSNKTKLIAEHFDWVQSVDRISIAKRLNDQRPAHLKPLNICIEINIDEEKTKSGVLPHDAFELAKNIISLKHLKLRGIMTIPEKNNSTIAFQKMAALYQKLTQEGFELDTLSMGMSDDYIDAIAAGSTMVRIGTAIFGERKI